MIPNNEPFFSEKEIILPNGDVFIRTEICLDGNCGYTAFGITRNNAYELITKNITMVHKLLKPAIEEALLTVPFIEFVKRKKLSLDLVQTFDEYKENNDSDPVIAFVNDLVIAQAYLDYDIREKHIDGGWAHPCVLQALAEILGISLLLYQLQNSKIIPYPQYHEYASTGMKENDEPTRLLFVKLNHFERLEPRLNHNEDFLSAIQKRLSYNFLDVSFLKKELIFYWFHICEIVPSELPFSEIVSQLELTPIPNDQHFQAQNGMRKKLTDYLRVILRFILDPRYYDPNCLYTHSFAIIEQKTCEHIIQKLCIVLADSWFLNKYPNKNVLLEHKELFVLFVFNAIFRDIENAYKDSCYMYNNVYEWLLHTVCKYTNTNDIMCYVASQINATQIILNTFRLSYGHRNPAPINWIVNLPDVATESTMEVRSIQQSSFETTSNSHEETNIEPCISSEHFLNRVDSSEENSYYPENEVQLSCENSEPKHILVSGKELSIGNQDHLNGSIQTDIYLEEQVQSLNSFNVKDERLDQNSVTLNDSLLNLNNQESFKEACHNDEFMDISPSKIRNNENGDFIEQTLRLMQRSLQPAPLAQSFAIDQRDLYFEQFKPYIFGEIRESIMNRVGVIERSDDKKNKEMTFSCKVTKVQIFKKQSFSCVCTAEHLPDLDHDFMKELLLVKVDLPDEVGLNKVLSVATKLAGLCSNDDDYMYDNETVKVKILTLRFEFNTMLINFFKVGCEINYYWLVGLINYSRMYEACHAKYIPPFGDQFICAKLPLWPSPTTGSFDINSRLNHRQQEIVDQLLQVSETENGLYLLQGPPGTGKTTTIISLLKRLAAKELNKKTPGRILVCAPSNKATRVILSKAITELDGIAHLALVGVSKELPEELKSVFVDGYPKYLCEPWIQLLKSNFKENPSKSVEQYANNLSEQLDLLEQQIQQNSSLCDENLKTEFCKYKSEIRYRLDNIQNNQIEQDSREEIQLRSTNENGLGTPVISPGYKWNEPNKSVRLFTPNAISGDDGACALSTIYAIIGTKEVGCQARKKAVQQLRDHIHEKEVRDLIRSEIKGELFSDRELLNSPDVNFITEHDKEIIEKVKNARNCFATKGEELKKEIFGEGTVPEYNGQESYSQLFMKEGYDYGVSLIDKRILSMLAEDVKKVTMELDQLVDSKVSIYVDLLVSKPGFWLGVADKSPGVMGAVAQINEINFRIFSKISANSDEIDVICRHESLPGKDFHDIYLNTNVDSNGVQRSSWHFELLQDTYLNTQSSIVTENNIREVQSFSAENEKDKQLLIKKNIKNLIKFILHSSSVLQKALLQRALLIFSTLSVSGRKDLKKNIGSVGYDYR